MQTHPCVGILSRAAPPDHRNALAVPFGRDRSSESAAQSRRNRRVVRDSRSSTARGIGALPSRDLQLHHVRRFVNWLGHCELLSTYSGDVITVIATGALSNQVPSRRRLTERRRPVGSARGRGAQSHGRSPGGAVMSRWQPRDTCHLRTGGTHCGVLCHYRAGPSAECSCAIAGLWLTEGDSPQLPFPSHTDWQHAKIVHIGHRLDE